jgi:hypothetical protein
MDHFENRTFSVPGPARTYDRCEHVSDNDLNLLVPSFPPPPVIPGAWNQSGTEKKEIFDRIQNADWDVP